jgi:hypothetical protein
MGRLFHISLSLFYIKSGFCLFCLAAFPLRLAAGFPLIQSAIRTRTISVPVGFAKSGKRNEAHPIYKTGSAS